MTLRLVYRAYGGENLKNRPSFFSKRVALASFVRAAEEADAEITFLNDGPMPPELTELMAGRGEQVPIPGGPIGLRGSYVKGLLLPSERGWAEDDIVYFCEDDYLHTQDSLTSLIRAAAELKHATYFTLHGNLPRTRADFPPGWVHRPSEHVGETSWMNIPSTTSTFGARVGAIAEDMPIFRQCMRPFRRSFLDHETCLLYQGYQPYDLNGLLAGPIERRGHGIGAAAKNGFLIPFRLGMNLRARTRQHRRHLLYSSDPNLACHLESEHLAPGVDWAQVAEQTKTWAADAGHRVGRAP